MSKFNGWDVFEPAFEAWWRARPHLDATKGLAHEAWKAGQRASQEALREALTWALDVAWRYHPDGLDIDRYRAARALASTVSPREPVTEGEQRDLCSYCGHPRNSATCQRSHP